MILGIDYAEIERRARHGKNHAMSVAGRQRSRQVGEVMPAMLQMTKIEIEGLKRATRG